MSGTITFRGTQLNDPANGFKLQLTSPFPGFVTTRGKDVTVPHRRGRIAMPRIADTRTITIEGWVEGEDIDEYRFLSDLFHEVFDTELDAGELTLAAPYLGLGSDWTINARTLNVVAGPLQGGGTFRHFSVELESVDPDWVASGSGS